jgi:putative transcriptional regulator
MLIYTINVLQALKEKGYNTTRIRRENILSQSTLQKLREGKPLASSNIDTICGLLECQPGDFIKWAPDDETADGE